MEQSKSDPSIANDVLHSDNHSKLTPQEIAKAVAHHQKHHPEERQQNPAKGGQGKKQGASRQK